MFVCVGKMSECPSYVGITINDRQQGEELINYDLVVFCPPQFNVTFWLPNWGQRSSKTFDVQLRDSRRTYAVFLTRLLLDPPAADQSTLTTTQTPAVDDVEDVRELPTVLAVVAGVTLTLVVLLVVLTLCVRLRSTSSTSSAGVVRKHARPCRVGAYVTVRVVYSVAVSFAALLLTLSIVVRPEVLRTSSADSRRLTGVSGETWWIDDDDVDDEALRQVRDARARHAACARYVNQMYAVVLERVANVRSVNQSRCIVGGDSGTMERLDVAVRQYAGVTQSAVDDYRRRVSSTVSTLASVRTRRLAQLYRSDWFDFAVGLSNRTGGDQRAAAAVRRPDTLPDVVTAATLTRPEVDFASFIDVDVVRDTMKWLDQFWRR